MDLGDWGVGESGRFAPTFTHAIHSPGAMSFRLDKRRLASFGRRNLFHTVILIHRLAEKTFFLSFNHFVGY